MGKKLDVLLGRKFRTSKLKTTLNHAISRFTILNNHRHARFNIARSDLVQLLRLNHHEQALLRVEQVIKDQNMLDVYDMIHGYCNLLIQRINLIEQSNDCPEELKEATSNILYAAPRCGAFPELQEIRDILTTRFGKHFVCGVSEKMIEKMSQKQLSLECRMKMLEGIARENGIVLQLKKYSPEIIKEEKLVVEMKPSQLDTKMTEEKIKKVLRLSESVKIGLDSPNSQPKKVFNSDLVKSKLDMVDFKSQSQTVYENSRYDSESESEDERSKYKMKVEEFDDSYSYDYSGDDDDVSLDKIGNDEKGLPSRNAYFSSYKQFPKAGMQQLDLKNKLNSEYIII